MAKDDYIRFRCSTDLKELVGKQAEEKGMNITDYMEYLIRRDGNNMMYVYWLNETPDEFGDDILERMANNGLGVLLDDEHLLSRNKCVVLDGIEIRSYETFEDWILGLDGQHHLEITEDLTIDEYEVLESFAGELYQPANDKGETYAEIIYKSENPYDKIEEYINTFIGIAINFKIDEIRCKADLIKESLKDGSFEW